MEGRRGCVQSPATTITFSALARASGRRGRTPHCHAPARISHGFALRGVHQMMDCAARAGVALVCERARGRRLTFFNLIVVGRQMLRKSSEDAVSGD